jgi:hypothetical protein
MSVEKEKMDMDIETFKKNEKMKKKDLSYTLVEEMQDPKLFNREKLYKKLLKRMHIKSENDLVTKLSVVVVLNDLFSEYRNLIEDLVRSKVLLPNFIYKQLHLLQKTNKSQSLTDEIKSNLKMIIEQLLARDPLFDIKKYKNETIYFKQFLFIDDYVNNFYFHHIDLLMKFKFNNPAASVYREFLLTLIFLIKQLRPQVDRAEFVLQKRFDKWLGSGQVKIMPRSKRNLKKESPDVYIHRM